MLPPSPMNYLLSYALKNQAYTYEYFATRDEAQKRADQLAKTAKGWDIEPRIGVTDRKTLGKYTET